MKPLLLAALLVGCGHVTVPCPQPHPAQAPCEPARCREGDIDCGCWDTPEGRKCEKVTSCPLPVPADARVSR